MVGANDGMRSAMDVILNVEDYCVSVDQALELILVLVFRSMKRGAQLQLLRPRLWLPRMQPRMQARVGMRATENSRMMEVLRMTNLLC